MSNISLYDEDFWTWLSTLEPLSGIGRYLGRIAGNQIESGYILDLIKEEQYDHKSSEIFDKLGYYMPRHHFLEVDFCAKTYATIFSRIFPPLMARVGELAYIEWLLYTEPDNPRYRDHLIHMFKVAYTGDRLLSEVDGLKNRIVSWQFGCEHFSGWCRERKLDVSSFGEEDKAQIIELAFFFAALFHDFGYGYYFHRKYKERLFRLYEWILPASDLTDSACQRVQLLLQSLACAFVKDKHAWLRTRSKSNKAFQTLQTSVVSGFLHDCLPLNHSIASAFFIIDMAEKLWAGKAINTRLYIALNLAAEAAMIHDMTEDDRWVHLLSEKHGHFLDADCHNHIPMAMLLIFADELSTWNRYRLKTECEKNRVIYSMDDDSVPRRIIVATSGDKIIVKPLHNRSHDLAKDPILHAFNNQLKFLRKRKRDRHLKMMGYKVYVKPRYS